jgi:CRISPR-associated protein Cas1
MVSLDEPIRKGWRLIKRTIEISQQSAHLSVRHGQLQINRKGQVIGSVPCEDIGLLIVDHPEATYSHAALASLVESQAAVVICGRNHMPAGLLLPLSDHGEVVWRLQDQLAASKPLCKRLWKQLIQSKIRASARNIPANQPANSKLLDLAKLVRSGDPSNVEARAARVYWQSWLPEHPEFRRDIDGGEVNALLNYGYAIVRAALSRAIVAAGLVPALGLKHSHRANSFALADDLIEPLRALVDSRVRDLFRQGHTEVNKESKGRLLTLLAEDVRLGSETGPLMVCLHRYVGSLVRCFRGEAKQLAIPECAITSSGRAPASGKP